MTHRLSLSMALLCSCAMTAAAQTSNPPANICVELTGWISDSQQKAGSAAAGQRGAANQQQSTGEQTAAQAPQQEGATQESGDPAISTAVEQARPGGEQTPRGTDAVQRSAGVSGSVTQEGPGASGPQGDAQETAKSGSGNPKPEERGDLAPKPPEPEAPPPSAEAVEKARQAAGANDLDGCAATVRDMRLAGVALPGPLLALAALKPELLQKAPQGPAPGVPPIPPSGVQTSEPASDDQPGATQSPSR